MSIENKLSTLTSTISDIRESITDKNIPLSTSSGFKIYPDAVRAIGIQDFSEPLQPTIHGVNYYDYNGDLLYVYTPQEFLALTAHPSQPAHTGLVADGWNWKLTDAQTFIGTTCDCLNIGGHYITDTGDTRIYIELNDDDVGTNIWFGVYYRQSIANGLTIDWGDGTTNTSGTVINSNNTNFSHTYTSALKNYIIKITPATNCVFTLGNTASYYAIFGYTWTTQRARQNNIKKIELGKGVSLSNGCGCRWSYSIETISIPKTVESTTVAGTFFNSCTNLKCVVLPEGINSVANDSFNGNFQIKALCLPKSLTTFAGGVSVVQSCDSIILPQNVTTINNTTPFRYGWKVRRVYIPNNVTTFAQYALADMSCLEEIHLPQGNENFTTLTAYLLVNSGMNYLEIPETVTTLGNQSVSCQALETVVMRSTTPPTADTINVFLSNTPLKIYVPYSADHSVLTAYKEANNWTQWASKIYEADIVNENYIKISTADNVTTPLTKWCWIDHVGIGWWSSDVSNYPPKIYINDVLQTATITTDTNKIIFTVDDEDYEVTLTASGYPMSVNCVTGYVKDGLVFRLDGITKGTNDTTKWVDLVGNVEFTEAGNTSCHDTNCIHVTSSQRLVSNSTPTFPYSTHSIECATSDPSSNWVFILRTKNSSVAAIVNGDYRFLGAGGGGYKPASSPGHGKLTSMAGSLCVINGTQVATEAASWSINGNGPFVINSNNATAQSYAKTFDLYSIRIYNRLLTQDEMVHNQQVDNRRFNLGLTL